MISHGCVSTFSRKPTFPNFIQHFEKGFDSRKRQLPFCGFIGSWLKIPMKMVFLVCLTCGIFLMIKKIKHTISEYEHVENTLGGPHAPHSTPFLCPHLQTPSSSELGSRNGMNESKSQMRNFKVLNKNLLFN